MYVTKFEEYGWDDKSLLSEMTDGDIEMCIPKPGHKAKFKRALRRELHNPSVASQTDMHTEYDQEDGHIKVADMESTLILAGVNSSETKADADQLLVSADALEQRLCHIVIDKDATNKGNVHLEQKSDDEAFCGHKEATTVEIQSLLEPVSASSNNLAADNKEDTKEPPVAADHIDHIENQITNILIDPVRNIEECFYTESDSWDHELSEAEVARKEITESQTV